MNTGKLKRFITKKLQVKLSEKISYLGVLYTMYVLRSCNQYINRMQIPAYKAYLLQAAAIMHDTGYIWSFNNHEDRSIIYAKEILPDWNYSKEEISKIVGMIKATEIPQTPTNRLEQVIGDSDLDYLGTALFYKIGNKLYRELLALNKITTEKE